MIAALAFVVMALPASLAARFLPRDVQASEPGGTLWHGSVAELSSHGRSLGAAEWRVHPASLLTGKLAASVRWVRQDLSVDAELIIAGKELIANSVRGGGSLESLANFGMTRGWNGKLRIHIATFTLAEGKVRAAAGEIHLDGLSSTDFPGVDFGGATLTFGPEAVQNDGTAIAQVSDAGSGPLQLSGTLTLAPAQSLATFSGKLKQREPLPGDLQQKINELAQMRGRDAQGRIALDIEFVL
ncbi:MAG: type II secretion system protein N [Proteobacteria bacterium]|nr:type II secretion system protein N [Pseudomonadota bacterium]